MLNSKGKVIAASAILGIVLVVLVAVVSSYAFPAASFLASFVAAVPLLALSVFFLKRRNRTDLTPIGVLVAVMFLAVISVLAPWELVRQLLGAIGLSSSNGMLPQILFNFAICALQGICISAVFYLSYKLFDVLEKLDNKNIGIYAGILALCALLSAGLFVSVLPALPVPVPSVLKTALVFFVAFCPNSYIFASSTEKETATQEKRE